MKPIKLLLALWCLPSLILAQLPYQQSFESNSGYTTSVPFSSSGSDYFQRFNNGQPGNWGATVSGYNGSYYIGVEDHDFYTSNPSGPTEITVTTDAINITGSSNLEVKIRLGATGDNPPTNNRYEISDYLYVEYQLNGSGSWVIIGKFGGNSSPFYHDVARNGVTGTGDDVKMLPAMADITYNINTIVGSPVTGSSMKIRVRFSLAGPQEEVQFDDIRVTGTAASCSITDLTPISQSPCANNLYTQQVAVTYSNAPASGSLIVHGQSFPITSSPQTVTLTNLVANGNPVNVTANFTAAAACTYTENNLFTAPAACVVCSIDAITAGNQLPCSIGTSKYAQEVIVSYTFPPASGSLNVNGQIFPITGSPQTCLLTNLPVNGSAVNVTASFTANTGCTSTINSVFTAPSNCPCIVNSPGNLVTQSFEGPTDYVGYSTSTPFFNVNSDAFDRGQDSDFSFDNGTPPVGEDGLQYIYMEDVTGNQWLQLDPVGILGYKNLKVKMKLAALGNSTRYETNDFVQVQMSVDNAAWTTIGQYGGVTNGGNYYLDAALNGLTGTGDDILMTPTMHDATFDIDAVVGYGVQGSSIRIRVLFNADGPQDEIAFDHIRLDGTQCDPICSISALSAGTQTPCIGNKYTQEVVVTFVDAPSSGTLDVNGQSFTIGVSPQTVTLTNLVADGNPVNVTANFSANTGCSNTAVSLFTAPAACPCNISGIVAGSQTTCDKNMYNQNVMITYSTPPLTGTLDVNGQSFAITGSPQLVTLINLVADGNPVNVTAEFSANTNCSNTVVGLFTAPAPCPCNISTITASTQTPCINNLYDQTLQVTYSNPPATGTLDVNGQSFPITSSPQTVTLLNLVADGNPVDVTAAFSADLNCSKTEVALFTGPVPCSAIPCSLTKTFTYKPLPASITNYGVFDETKYYWGLSKGGMPIEVTPSGGVGPYTYQWSNSNGYNLGKANTNKVYLWYPKGPFWLKITITDVGANCVNEDSVYVDWIDDYTCNPPGEIWYYQLCRNGGTPICVHTWWNMVDSLATGNYTFGDCSNQPETRIGQGDDLNNVSMNLFPNPTSPEIVTYMVEGENIARYKVEVMDVNGRKYYENMFVSKENKAMGKIDLNHLTPGVYLVRVTTNDGVAVNRLIIN